MIETSGEVKKVSEQSGEVLGLLQRLKEREISGKKICSSCSALMELI